MILKAFITLNSIPFKYPNFSFTHKNYTNNFGNTFCAEFNAIIIIYIHFPTSKTYLMEIKIRREKQCASNTKTNCFDNISPSSPNRSQS